METIHLLYFLAIFTGGAISDIKKREVKDELSIALWLLCAFLLSTQALQLMVVTFCFIWAIAILGEKFKTKVFGWGDILWGAPFIGIAAMLSNPKTAFVLFALSFVAGQVYLHWQYNVKNLPKEQIRGVPFVAYLAVALLLSIFVAI